MVSTGPLISILVNSNNPNNLVDFFNSYEKNSYNVKNFEIVVNIDKDDYSMLNLLNDQKIIRSFDIKYIETTGGYFSGHIHNNLMLKESNPSSYFVICAGDRMLVKTKNWDKIILEYKESFRDNIFRVKCSSHKYRNYTDYWECCFAPANIAFTTRKWLDICGDWAPCFSGDAFQQCISYYMFKFDNFNSEQINRDIVDTKLQFGGQEPEEKNQENNYLRINGQLQKWKILTSHKFQKEAKKRSMKILANIFLEENNVFSGITYSKNSVNLINVNAKSGKKYKNMNLDYKINYLLHTLKNYIRLFNYLNYSGSGFYKDSFTLRFNITWYLSHRYIVLKNIKDKFNNYFNDRKYK